MNKLDQVRTWIKRYGLQNVILRGAKMILPIQELQIIKNYVLLIGSPIAKKN